MQRDDDFYDAMKQHYEYANTAYDNMLRGRTTEPKDNDVIKSPEHYAQWRIEPATFIMANDFEFWRGNIVKYASRAGFKKYDNKDMRQSEITDLQKIIRYAEMRIEQLEAER